VTGEFGWDVAVIGAGPAGSAVAYHLASRQHRVVLLERSVFPRDKACGDGLTRTSVELLSDLGVLETFRSSPRITGARLINRGRGQHDAPYRPRGRHRPGHGLVVPRIRLDDILRQNAMAAGADLWERCRASEVLTDGERIVGVRVDHDGEEFDLRARFFIFADGGSGSLARQIGLGPAGRLSTGFAMRGYYTDLMGIDPVFQMHVPLANPTDGAIVPGYGWVFPLSATDANIGVGFFVGQQKDLDLNLRRLFDSFLDDLRTDDERFTAMRRVGELKGARLNCGFDPARCWGPQALVIGDAAGLVDPFTGEGIDTALESAKCAADVLSSALELRQPEAAPLGDYASLLVERFRDRFDVGRKAIKTYLFTWKLLDSTLEVRRPLFRVLRETLLDYGTEDEPPSCIECAQDWSWLTSCGVRRFIQEVEGQVASTIRTEYAILAQAAPKLVDPRGRLARIILSLMTARLGLGDIVVASKVATAIELGFLAQQVQLDIEEDPQPPRREADGNEPNWGNRFTVMVGAYLLAQSSRMFAALDSKCLVLASRTSAEACGAWLRERSYGRGRCSEEAYLQILPLKAGGFFALESRLSGSLNGLSEMWIRALESCATHLGVALHLRHEVEQFVQDDAKRKDHPIVRLLESGSFSLPMIRALLADKLPVAIDQGSIDVRTINHALATVRASGALSATSRLQREFAERAADSLSTLPSVPETNALRDLCSWLLSDGIGRDEPAIGGVRLTP